MRNYLYIIMLMASFSLSANTQNTLSVCTDDENWFPYIYFKGDETNDVEGIAISTTQRIFSELGFKANYSAYPWLRCLEQLKTGTVDVLIAGTYTRARAEYAHFPPDAEKLVDSKYVLARDPFIIVTSKDTHFVYNKNDNAIPMPIRSVHGYNITEEFIALGLPVKEHYSSKDAIEELIRSKRGSVIINRMTANMLLNEPKYGNYLQYNSTPVRVLPYFVMFSKATKNLSKQQRLKFYQSLELWRERTSASYTF